MARSDEKGDAAPVFRNNAEAFLIGTEAMISASTSGERGFKRQFSANQRLVRVLVSARSLEMRIKSTDMDLQYRRPMMGRSGQAHSCMLSSPLERRNTG